MAYRVGRRLFKGASRRVGSARRPIAGAGSIVLLGPAPVGYHRSWKVAHALARYPSTALMGISFGVNPHGRPTGSNRLSRGGSFDEDEPEPAMIANSKTPQRTPATGPAVDVIAAEALAALDPGDQIPPFSGRDASFDLERAYAVTAALRRLRTARGETHIGRKIGFTNRTIWAEYGVYAPIWGDMYDSTVHAVTHGAAFALGRMAEPRIEPEIAFKLKAAPAPGMDAAALLGTIEWLAHGFEIVTSIFPGWQFSAADVVAGGGVHGALLLGPAQTVDPRQVADLARALETFEITLERNDVAADRGQAANVLGGPLHA